MDKSTALQFGEWIQARLDRMGLTQSEFWRLHLQNGPKGGPVIGKSTLNELKNGKTTVRNETAKLIGARLGASELETLAAMGEIHGLPPSDVQLVEDVISLPPSHKRMVGALIAQMKKEQRE